MANAVGKVEVLCLGRKSFPFIILVHANVDQFHQGFDSLLSYPAQALVFDSSLALPYANLGALVKMGFLTPEGQPRPDLGLARSHAVGETEKGPLMSWGSGNDSVGFDD